MQWVWRVPMAAQQACEGTPSAEPDTRPGRPLPVEGWMPRVYRVMEAEHGKPLVGRSATALGVRVDGHADVSLEADSFVAPEGGGMSVSPSLRTLPAHRIPRRLSHLVPAARGKNNRHVW